VTRRRRKYYSRKRDNTLTAGLFLILFFIFSGALSSIALTISNQPLLTSFLCGVLLSTITLATMIGRQRRKRRILELLKINQDIKATRTALTTFEVLEPYEFEHAVADMFEAQGYHPTVTPSRNDKGIDIYLRKGETLFAVQCKRYQGSVGPGDIRDFAGALDAKRIKEGFFVTTGEFTHNAHAAAKNSSRTIHLIDGQSLGKWRRKLIATPLAPIEYNTDLINAPWWRSLTVTQKGVLIGLGLLVVWGVATAGAYLMMVSYVLPMLGGA